MRLLSVRAPSACLVAGWSLLIAVHGTPAASALSAAPTALAATSSQCEPLPSGSTPSPSPSSPTELCVSVQASQSGIQRGQAATYTVQVSAENGPASGVYVTLAGAPQGEDPEFTSRCPGGDGSATCTIGSMATEVSPSEDQMQAQIQVASGATSVTSVTLTATVDATTSPAMAELPTASETVTVSAPTAAASTPAASTSAINTPSPVASASTVPAAAGTPTVGPTPTNPGAASPSLISPGYSASTLPVTTPAAVAISSSVAATPSNSSFTVVVGTSAVKILGLIVLGLVLLPAGTRLVRGHLAARRAAGAKSQRKGRGAQVWPHQGIINKRLRFGRARAGQQAGAGTSDDETVRVPRIESEEAQDLAGCRG